MLHVMADPQPVASDPASSHGRAAVRDSGTLRIVVRQRAKQSLRHTGVIVHIDGVAYAGHWGVQDLSVRSGEHRVAVSFRYFGALRGRAQREITIARGETMQLDYLAPWFLFGT